MSLDAAARRRYARQLLLGEIDEAGQVRLLDSRFRRTGGSDAEALAVAVDYLGRAGCSFGEGGTPLELPDEAAVSSFAGAPELCACAAAVMGAFAAVEYIKESLGMCGATEFPEGLRLRAEK